MSTTQNGVVVRADVTRIAGTYWNFTGYWRGRLNSSFGEPRRRRRYTTC